MNHADKEAWEALRSENKAQLEELHRISDALGTREGHSSVAHIKALREQLAEAISRMPPP